MSKDNFDEVAEKILEDYKQLFQNLARDEQEENYKNLLKNVEELKNKNNLLNQALDAVIKVASPRLYQAVEDCHCYDCLNKHRLTQLLKDLEKI